MAKSRQGVHQFAPSRVKKAKFTPLTGSSKQTRTTVPGEPKRAKERGRVVLRDHGHNPNHSNLSGDEKKRAP